MEVADNLDVYSKCNKFYNCFYGIERTRKIAIFEFF